MTTEILTRDQLAERLQVNIEQISKLTADGRIPHIVIGPRLIRYDLGDVCRALRVAKHPDDDAVDTFAEQLRKRMAEKRDQGRGGWQETDIDTLQLKLLRSIVEGDPIDVGNYAMMIATLGGGTEHAVDRHIDTVLYETHSAYRLSTCVAIEQWNLIREAAGRVYAAWADEDGSIKEPMERLGKELAR